jgi:alpha-galactosidase
MTVSKVGVADVELTFELEGERVEGLAVTATGGALAGDESGALIDVTVQRVGGGQIGTATLVLRCMVPAIDMHGFYWAPPSADELTRLPFWTFTKRSGAQSGLPYLSLFHRDGANRFALGFLDQVTETSLRANLSELTSAFTFTWRKPLPVAARTAERWTEQLFVSRSAQAWPEVLQAYGKLVDRASPPSLPVPEFAFDPVFCTWTAVHHDVDARWALETARQAAELGFGTWLTDDGWYTDGGRFGDYRYAGDWQPSKRKFPNLREHVAAVQALGLRYVLWVAPYLVGHESRAAARVNGRLERPTETLYAKNLPVGDTETAELVGGTLERLVRDYGLDGLKVDFIDAIPLTPAGARGRFDGSVGAAVIGTLAGAVDRVAGIRPEVLIEVRNTYANLASRRWANVYRASDVPLNFAANRWQVTMLRLLAPDRAVHLDPALWHPGDTEANVAVHLINLIASVPMVSVDLARYPSSHRALIRHWMGFYRRHREAIVHGAFEPEIRTGRVPVTRFGGHDELIVGVYDDVAVRVDDARRTWLLNASTQPYVDLVVDAVPDEASGERQVRTHDRFGKPIGERVVRFPASRLDVEVGGSIEIGAADGQKAVA